MAKKITEIEGIGPVCSKKLLAAEIRTVEDLLEKGATRKGRHSLAEVCEVPEKRILRWVNMADLFRISGVGEEYADLLEASGVDTVKELRNRKPENLHARMVEVNAEKKLVRALPALSKVEKWVETAKGLDPKVSY